MTSNSLYLKNFISIPELTRAEIEMLIKVALQFKQHTPHDILKEKVIASCFFEPSTRTRLSFETAIQRLGGRVIGFSDAQNTSITKGETLADTARIISSYADAIVMRHYKDGATRLVGEFSICPVINAGDGTNQHPSQTLLDLISIQETQGSLENKKIALVGDLKYGRTVHSLVQALSLFNCEFYFLSPSNLPMPDYICEELDQRNIKYQTLESIEEAVQLVDILYMTRLQKERFDEQEFLKLKNSFILKANALDKAKSNLKILHPLPRIEEIHPEVDLTPYAYYFQQAQNGIYAREAILALVLNATLTELGA